MNKSIFSNNKLYIILHVSAWAILFILPLYLMNYETDKHSFFLKSIYLRTSIYVFVFYINYLWFIPRFLFSGKLKTYIISLAITLSCLFFVNEKGHEIFFRDVMKNQVVRETFEKLGKEKDLPKNPPLKYHLYDFLLTTLLVTGFSIGLKISGKLIKNEKEKKELEKEKLNSELAFLKNQISPHFFFNTLNNIYSLIQINTNDAQNSVLKLSKLMRYLLYESEGGDTMMSKEIEFMKNYIDLIQLRLTPKVDLKVSLPENYTDIPIAPLLFIPFIENAFKHGVSNRDKSFIHISLRMTGNEILFTCSNSKIINTSNNNENESGIGLENIIKRLKLLFPYKHVIDIKQTDDAFEVILKIDTSKN
jgi:two-component system LytT family sensor kinase